MVHNQGRKGKIFQPRPDHAKPKQTEWKPKGFRKMPESGLKPCTASVASLPLTFPDGLNIETLSLRSASTAVANNKDFFGKYLSCAPSIIAPASTKALDDFYKDDPPHAFIGTNLSRDASKNSEAKVTSEDTNIYGKTNDSEADVFSSAVASIHSPAITAQNNPLFCPDDWAILNSIRPTTIGGKDDILSDDVIRNMWHR